MKKIPKALGYGRLIFIENSKSRIQTSRRGTEQPEYIYIFRLSPNIIYEILIHISFWLWNAKMIITRFYLKCLSHPCTWWKLLVLLILVNCGSRKIVVSSNSATQHCYSAAIAVISQYLVLNNVSWNNSVFPNSAIVVIY